MKKQIKLTKEMLTDVGSLESFHHLAIPEDKLGDSYEVSIYGLNFNPYFLGITESINENVYVSGFSKLIFLNPTYVGMNLSYYTDETCKAFAKKEDGMVFHSSKAWGEFQNGDNPFVFGGVVLFPYAYSEIHVVAEKVLLETDTNDFIPLKEYIKEPLFYSYKML